jgi:hypothetical protein
LAGINNTGDGPGPRLTVRVTGVIDSGKHFCQKFSFDGILTVSGLHAVAGFTVVSPPLLLQLLTSLL